MKIWVAVTDNQWYNFLSKKGFDELNFWHPSSTSKLKAVPYGAPFLFKLHSPLNYIAGGGFYIKHSVIPLSMSWQTFGEKNGAPDFETFSRMIRKHRNDNAFDPYIGCTVLIAPFFFERSEWIPVPADWKLNIVQGKTYDTQEAYGKKLWNEVQARIKDKFIKETPISTMDLEPKFAEYLTKHRLGQGSFRLLVTDVYNRKCAITGGRTLPVLEAAHIKPVNEKGPHRTDNGLLLRSDLHILFDKRLITVTPDYHVEVSKKIKEEYENGKEYYILNGKKLQVLPDNPLDRPSKDFLDWHNNRFVA